MPRRLFKRYMPDPTSIREHKSLRFLGTLLHDPNLWHLNRHSVARAMAVGLFAAFLPIPLQMLVAAILAIMVRGNMPIAVSLVWLTNPITMPAVFFCTYQTGAWLMDVPARHLPDELTWEWISGELSTLLPPFWQTVSLANPVLHMVNAFRYGILGVSDIKISVAITFMLVATVALYIGCARLLVSGRGMRT